jgi:hypothetical protein
MASAGPIGGDRYYTAFVTVPDTSASPHGRRARLRVVAGSLLAAIAVVAFAAIAGRGPVGRALFAQGTSSLGAAATAEQMGELRALVSEAGANKRTHIVRLGQKLAWKNAGAVPDDNVFSMPATWKAPDDPLRPKSPPSKDEYTTSIHPDGGLEVVHSTDNGSPEGDSFAIDRTVDDVFHGSAPSPPPAVPETVWTMPQGDQFKITDPTDTGVAKTPTFTAFTIDTSTDDFFTHHANQAAQCFKKVDDKYLEDWFTSKQAFALKEAMQLCSVTKDCGGITKQEGYFGGLGWTLRHGKVPKDVIDPSGTIDTDLDLSRSCGPDRNAACPSSQSSTRSAPNTDGGDGVSARANDDKTDSGKYADGHCSSTNPETNPYWVEDFGSKRRITFLKVYGRSDEDLNKTASLEGFRVRASDKADVKAPSHLCASVRRLNPKA